MFDELLRNLAGPDDEARWRAGLALAEIGAPVVAELAKLLSHSDTRVRCAAINAVRGMGEHGADAVDGLIENATFGERISPDLPVSELTICRSAVYALGHIGPTALGAVPTLLDILRGEHQLSGCSSADQCELLAAAAWLIRRLGPDAARVCPDVVRALGDAHRICHVGPLGLNAARGVPSMSRVRTGNHHPEDDARTRAGVSVCTGDVVRGLCAISGLSKNRAAGPLPNKYSRLTEKYCAPRRRNHYLPSYKHSEGQLATVPAASEYVVVVKGISRRAVRASAHSAFGMAVALVTVLTVCVGCRRTELRERQAAVALVDSVSQLVHVTVHAAEELRHAREAILCADSLSAAHDEDHARENLAKAIVFARRAVVVADGQQATETSFEKTVAAEDSM